MRKGDQGVELGSLKMSNFGKYCHFYGCCSASEREGGVYPALGIIIYGVQ